MKFVSHIISIAILLNHMNLIESVETSQEHNNMHDDPASIAVSLDDDVDLPILPAIEETYEMAMFSSLIYENSKKDPMLSGDWQLEYYEDRIKTGNVMVASSKENERLVVVFAGSDGINDWMDDIDITQEPFGPKFTPINRDAWVHSGFNNVLFEKRVYEKNCMYDRIKHSVEHVLERDGIAYDIMISGHSLGGALSVLTGVAFAHQMPDTNFTVINFGCPRHGGKHFHKWSNDMTNVNIWRFVYHRDIVPRTPGETRFYHTGHTIQLESESGAKAYYYHKGNKELNLAGVPKDWNDGKSSSNHYMSNYIDYLEGYAYIDPEKYYTDSFEEATEFDFFDESDDENGSWILGGFDSLKETVTVSLRKGRTRLS